MRVLILGGTGYIGRALAFALEREPGMEVVCLSRHAFLSSQAYPLSTSTRLVTADLTLPQEIRAWYAALKPDVVIHAAGPPGDAQCARDRAMASSCHVDILPVLRDYPTRIIYLSTLLDPQSSWYAELKHAAEDVLLAYPLIHPTILRLGSVYGAGRNAGVVSKFIDAVLAGTPVTIAGEGQQVLPLVHIDDLVQAMGVVLRNAFPPLVQVAPPLISWVSVEELLERIEALVGTRVTRHMDSDAIVRPYAIDPAVPLISPPGSLDDGLRKAIVTMHGAW